MKLIFPELKHKEKALLFKREFSNNNEVEISGDSELYEYDNYEEWLSKINADLTREDNVYVPSTVYFSVVNESIVGIIQIRHKLNSFLLGFGGHIGYSIAPSERRKGYAAQMLKLALDKCKELSINKALITCCKNNIASAKTIIKNGGVLENEVLRDDGRITQRYWIALDD